jgi:hypothetical protein
MMGQRVGGSGDRVLIEYLSDHAGEMLRDSERQRLRASYDEAIWQTKHHEARAELHAARRNRPIWKRILSLPTIEGREALKRIDEAQQQISRADSRRRHLDHKVRQQAAGVDGEEALASGLSTLSDEWVMLRGYRNRRGETDHVLIGPRGLWAVEVKTYSVRLNVDGDRWWYERLDRWGNVVDTQPAVDGSGRTWARQVSDVAHDLADWLERNNQRIPVRTAVMLMHHRATLGRYQNAKVNLVGTHPQQLLNAITDHVSPLSPDACRAIAKLIRRDHRHHNNRRKRS